MNWNAVGAIGQILGSLATFITVGYLVVQVHDTERAMKREIAQSRTERVIEINLAQASNERLADITVRGSEALLLGKPRTPQIIPRELAERLKSAPPSYIGAAVTE